MICVDRIDASYFNLEASHHIDWSHASKLGTLMFDAGKGNRLQRLSLLLHTYFGLPYVQLVCKKGSRFLGPCAAVDCLATTCNKLNVLYIESVQRDDLAKVCAHNTCFGFDIAD
eukprot:3181179-Pleurochrysis_carterae.AAC.1